MLHSEGQGGLTLLTTSEIFLTLSLSCFDCLLGCGSFGLLLGLGGVIVDLGRIFDLLFAIGGGSVFIRGSLGILRGALFPDLLANGASGRAVQGRRSGTSVGARVEVADSAGSGRGAWRHVDRASARVEVAGTAGQAWQRPRRASVAASSRVAGVAAAPVVVRVAAVRRRPIAAARGVVSGGTAVVTAASRSAGH